MPPEACMAVLKIKGDSDDWAWLFRQPRRADGKLARKGIRGGFLACSGLTVNLIFGCGFELRLSRVVVHGIAHGLDETRC